MRYPDEAIVFEYLGLVVEGAPHVPFDDDDCIDLEWLDIVLPGTDCGVHVSKVRPLTRTARELIELVTP